MSRNPVRVGGLVLPSALVSVIESRRWRPPSDLAVYRRVFDDDPELPEFYDVAAIERQTSSCRSMTDDEKWWIGVEAPGSVGIDLSQSLVIASLGPDMPIILDYRLSPDSPRVLYLGVQGTGGQERVIWREVAPDIETLISRLDLRTSD
jgi:hypothetical protein